MEKFSKKLRTSRVLGLGRAHKKGNRRGRGSSGQLQKLDERKIISWLKAGVLILIPLLVLTPEIRNFSPAIRLDEVLLLPLIVLYLAYKYKKRTFRISVLDYLFGALALSVLVSMVAGYLRAGDSFYYRDLFELMKLAKYYLIYRIIYIIDWSKSDVKRVLKVSVVSFAVAVTFSLMQYFDIFSINSVLMPYFTRVRHIRGILVSGRVLGTFKNPNSWALALGVPIFYLYAVVIKKIEYKKADLKVDAPIFIFLFVVLTSLVMTMGRTAIVANFTALFFISAALWFFPYRSIGRPRIAREIFWTFSVFVVASALALTFVAYTPNRRGSLTVIERFQAGVEEISAAEGEEPIEYKSWSSREEKWQDVTGKALKSPVFGFGPSKNPKSVNNLNYLVDNEYLLYLYRYGLLGLFLYLGLLILFIYFGVINLKNTVTKMDGYFSINIIALGMAIAFPLYNLLAGSFYDFQLFPLYIIFNTLNIYILNKHEK